MPTYEYQCEPCNIIFEAFQNMCDPKHTICTECGDETLQRLIGAGAGFIFKDGAPGQDLKREKENSKIFRAAQLARRMKYHGVCKPDEVISVKDVKGEKYDSLPPIAPPSVKVPEPKKPE